MSVDRFKLLVAVTVLTVLSICKCEDSHFMEKHGVVPDVIDAPPPTTLEVVYPNNVIVEEGNELTPTQVKDEPIVKWVSEDESYYLLVMTDPDAPSREQPTVREFNHWLVGNIPGNDIAKGEILNEYVGSGPPKDTGLHRYVFLVYKQPNKITFNEKQIPKTSRIGRPNFSIRNFAKKYNVGEPIAGNLYQAQYDNYVPTIHQQLSG